MIELRRPANLSLRTAKATTFPSAPMFECNYCRLPRMGLCHLSMVVAAAATVLCVQQLFSPHANVSLGTVTSRNVQVGRTDHSVYRQNSVIEEFLPTTTYTGSEQGILASRHSPVTEERVVSGTKPHFVIHCGPMKTGTSSLYVLKETLDEFFLENLNTPNS